MALNIEKCMIEIDGCELSAKNICTKSSTVLYPGWLGERDYIKTFHTNIISFVQNGQSGHIQMDTSTGGEYENEKDKIVYDNVQIFRPESVQINKRHMYIKDVEFAEHKIIFKNLHNLYN